MNLVTMKNISKTIGVHSILSEVNLSVAKGATLALVGPSGSGKSTILRILNTLDPFDCGELQVAGVQVTPANYSDKETKKKVLSKVGILFQSYNLFPHWTVLENVSKAPMIVKKRPKAEVVSLATHLLEKVGLADCIHRFPHQISGGQAQRVAIARALAMEPEIVLYDEPTSALDPWVAKEVLQVMKRIKSDGITQIVVTHDLRFALGACDQVALLAKGKVVECRSIADLVSGPKDTPTARYFQSLEGDF